MGQTNYQKGYRLELRAAKELRAHGYYVIRSAGSHGPADVIALNSSRIIIIQIGTTGSKGPKDEDLLRRVPAPSGTLRQIWLWDKNARQWEVETVTE